LPESCPTPLYRVSSTGPLPSTQQRLGRCASVTLVLGFKSRCLFKLDHAWASTATHWSPRIPLHYERRSYPLISITPPEWQFLAYWFFKVSNSEHTFTSGFGASGFLVPPCTRARVHGLERPIQGLDPTWLEERHPRKDLPGQEKSHCRHLEQEGRVKSDVNPCETSPMNKFKLTKNMSTTTMLTEEPPERHSLHETSGLHQLPSPTPRQ
jgi:hypothetical protein